MYRQSQYCLYSFKRKCSARKEGFNLKKIIMITSLLLALILCAFSAATVFAVSIYTDGDYKYIDVDQYHVGLYDYTGESSVLTVPAYFSDRSVSQIYEFAFENRDDLTSIDFSQTQGQLDFIGAKAFNGCTGLSGTLSLPASLRTLGYAAFQGCTGLDTLYVNLGIRDIPEQCFNRCAGLRYVYLPTELETIGRLAFANCTDLEYVYIPSTVTYINPYAFTNSEPVLYVNNESYAQQYAIDNGFDYVIIDPPSEPTEPPTEPEPTEAPTEPEPSEAPTEPEPSEAPTEPPTEPEPTEIPTEYQPTEPSGYYLGDVDCNGQVDIVDATIIQRRLAYIAHIDGCDITHGDVDGDGSITIIDVTYIQRYLAEIDTPYPIGIWIAN